MNRLTPKLLSVSGGGSQERTVLPANSREKSREITRSGNSSIKGSPLRGRGDTQAAPEINYEDAKPGNRQKKAGGGRSRNSFRNKTCCLYRAAAELGGAAAQCNLGIDYRDGVGTPNSPLTHVEQASLILYALKRTCISKCLKS